VLSEPGFEVAEQHLCLRPDPGIHRGGPLGGGAQFLAAWVKDSSRILSAFLLTCEEAIEATRPVTE
jgi:hypothetical protein